MADRKEAQRKRAEARQRRRRQEQPENGPTEPSEDGAGSEEPLDAVKRAAKVAAAGAAVGATAAAARALTQRGDPDDDAPEEEPEHQPEPEPADEEPGTESRGDEPEPEQEPEQQEEDEQEPHQPAPMARYVRADRPDGVAPGDAAATVQRAREQLEALLEHDVDSVSAFERTNDGWLVTLEVVEVSRIPESTDVLASYEMELDDDRNLRRYARVRRYHRSQADGVDR